MTTFTDTLPTGAVLWASIALDVYIRADRAAAKAEKIAAAAYAVFDAAAAAAAAAPPR